MKKLTALAAAFVLTGSLFAMDWGGVIKNNSEVLTPDFSDISIEQSDALYMWATQPLSKDGSFYASGEAYYKFKLVNEAGTNTITNIVDVDLLKVSGNIEFEECTFTFDAGRFLISDSTGVIFSQTCDGTLEKSTLSLAGFSAYLGYTGLLNSNAVTMLDINGNAYANKKGVYVLSHEILPFMYSVDFPVLFGNQSLSVQGAAFIELTQEMNNRCYGNLVLSGPIANSVYYQLATSIGSVNFKNIMNYSALDVYIFPMNSMLVNTGIEYASGNNGPFSAFRGVTSRTAYNSASYPETSGVLMAKASAGISLNSMYASAAAKFVMDCADSFGAKGLEFDVNYSYNIFSDLQVGLDVTAYMDFVTATENNYTATLRAAMSF